MKHISKLVMILLLGTQASFGQIVHVHTHINNNDSKTRGKLLQLIALLGARNGTLGGINGQLSTALANHQLQLKSQYTKNQFDRKNSFIVSAAGSSLLSVGASTLASRPRLPYMTKEKREYINAVTMDKALLLALQVVSKSKIKSSKRQEIYRLRSKLLRELSKNDRDARQSLFFSAAGLLVRDYEEFVKLYGKLKIVQIAL